MKILFLFLVLALTINAQGSIVAVGGGSEDNGGWSDEPYGWMVEKADSGKVLILSYDDNSTWLPNYFKSLGASESFILNINNSAIADQQSTYDEIISSNGIFIKGGNQYLYYSRINGTLAEDAIREVYNGGGVIGGTSAGAMVLGEYVFTSERASVDPAYGIRNPLGSQITIENDFVALTDDVLFDTHFIQRGRWGRMIGFIYNVFYNSAAEVIGVGIDDKTAICIDEYGVGTVYGTGAVSVFQIDDLTLISGDENDYTIERLKCDQLTENWEFDFINREISFIPPSARAVSFPIPTYYVSTDAYLNGSSSFNDLLNENLDTFLDLNRNANIGVIYNSGYDFYKDIFSDSLNANGIEHTSIPVAEDLINDASLADSINSCDVFIFIGNDLEKLSLLNNQQSNVGNALHQKMIDNSPIYFHGSTAKLNGSFLVDNTDSSPNASYYGNLEVFPGISNTPGIVFQNDIFKDEDYYENRSAAVLYGMMRRDIQRGIYFDYDDFIKLQFSDQSMQLLSDRMPLMTIDGSQRTYVDSSTYVISSSDPRQVVAMNNLRYSVSTFEKSLNLINGSLSPISSVELGEYELNKNFILYNNYPNPFNPSTEIKFQLNFESHQVVSLKVYDVLGREVANLVDRELSPGTYNVYFNAGDLSTGVYFYKLTYGSFSQTKKMLLLK